MRSVIHLLMLASLTSVVGCKPRQDTPAPAASQLVSTSIAAADCRREINTLDPNSLPYLVCAGVAGAQVHVRSVEAGKVSIDLVMPDQRVVPLSLQAFVSRHMYGLESPLLWRLEQQAGAWQARALVIQVAERADADDPALVTRRIEALAKVSGDGACVVAVRPATTAATTPASGGDAAWMAQAMALPCAKTWPD